MAYGDPTIGSGYPALGMATAGAPGTPDVAGGGTAVWSQPGQGIYGPSPQTNSTSWLTMTPPLLSAAARTTRVLRNPVANAPLPPANPFRAPTPNINVPVGQVAQSGSGSLWDALRSLFSGQPSAQGQGMTGMLGRPSHGVDALGNPFNRFG